MTDRSPSAVPGSPLRQGAQALIAKWREKSSAPEVEGTWLPSAVAFNYFAGELEAVLAAAGSPPSPPESETK